MVEARGPLSAIALKSFFDELSLTATIVVEGGRVWLELTPTSKTSARTGLDHVRSVRRRGGVVVRCI